MKSTEIRAKAGSAKSRLLDAAMGVLRAQGYAATTVEDICESAGVTKGAFFHHFASKEALAVAAAEHFSAMAEGLFAMQPLSEKTDPLDRVLAYVDVRLAILQGELPEFTCLLGTMVQEAYETHPAIRAACERGICGHAERLVADIDAAMKQHGVGGDWTAESLAEYTQAAIQGAFILAKAKHSAAAAEECIRHLRRYIELLFGVSQERKQAA